MGLDRSDRLSDFLLLLHKQTGVRTTCYTIANELRRLTNSDRVILVVRRNSRTKVEAVSNLAVVDPRSPVIREAERLARGCDEHPVWYLEGETVCESANHPSDAERDLLRFVDQSHSRTLAAIPLGSDSLTSDSTPIGMVICERFERKPYEAVEREELIVFCRHSGLALSKALALDRLPLIGLIRRFDRIFSARGFGWKSALGTVAAIALATFLFWPIEFTVSASGVVLPMERREVFAPADGVVREVLARHGDDVVAGDILLRMANDELEFDITRLLGEIGTARQKLAAVEASRLDSSSGRESRKEKDRGESGDAEQLKQVLQSLESQLVHREQQRDRLTVKSPMDGELLTWEVERLLLARPVRRGQRLMTIAAMDGQWQIEMHVVDRDVGHVLRAREKANRELPISFRLATDPNRVAFAKLTKVADWSEPAESGRPAARMTATIQDAASLTIRPGAATTARIHLGTRVRAYVWFRDVLEFVRVQLWL